MFTEAQIMVSVLLSLAAGGVAALPMHDGLIVGRGKAGKALRAMEEAGLGIAGRRLPVELKAV